MELKEMIFKRKSVRNYLKETLDKEMIMKIETFIQNVHPLNSEIKVKSIFLTNEEVKSIMPWSAPHYIAIYSEEKDNYLENVGFIYQQVDLYLQSIGLGSCWLGMGKSELKNSDDSLKFVIIMAFGFPKDKSERKLTEFRRQTLTEISDIYDERLEVVRVAPSAVNSQPWYFIHDKNVIHAYCKIHGLIKQKTIGKMNHIDMGIALAHLQVTYKENIEFLKVNQPIELKGYKYIYSFKIKV